MTEIYMENKVGDDVVDYTVLKVSNCKGSPVAYDPKDGEYMAPKLVINSITRKNALPYEIDVVASLPA